MTYRSSTRLFLYVVIALFALGYVFRYFFVSYYISENIILPIEYQEWNNINEGPLASAFLICTTIFAVFVGLYAATTRKVAVQAPPYKPVSAPGVIGIIAIVAVSLALRYIYGATLGQEASTAGVVFGTLNYRMQADFIPALILLFMELTWLAKQKRYYYFGMALLAVFFLTLSAITTSKAGMVFFLAQVVMLMYLTGQAVWKYPVRLTLAALGGVLTFIVASQLRAEALGIGDSAIWVSLQDGNIAETFLQVVGLIANRIPGVEGLALTCGHSCATLPTFQVPSLERGAIQIFTYDIVGITWLADFRSPGLMAGAIILAGLYGGAAMVLAALSLGKSATYQMDKRSFSSAARAAFVFGMLRFMMEGAWYWIDVVSMLAGVAAIEIIARAWRGKPRGN